MACIIVTTGVKQGEYYPLGQRTTVVGRDEALPVQILDERVSRKHMSIRFEPSDSSYRLLDMKSSNGVFLNGSRLTAESVLKDGDEIKLGDTVLMFTVADFSDKQSAVNHFKQAGQKKRSTLIK